MHFQHFLLFEKKSLIANQENKYLLEKVFVPKPRLFALFGLFEFPLINEPITIYLLLLSICFYVCVYVSVVVLYEFVVLYECISAYIVRCHFQKSEPPKAFFSRSKQQWDSNVKFSVDFKFHCCQAEIPLLHPLNCIEQDGRQKS